MGVYQSAYWLSDSWGAPSGTYHPYLPDTLTDQTILLSAETAAALSQAENDIQAINASGSPLTDTEPLARLILRSEALASSRIEGLETPAGRLLEREALESMGIPHRSDSTEAAVMANIRAMDEGVERAASTPELSVKDICDINRRLLMGTHMEGQGGMLRATQNWIGGNDLNPVGAAYVPPAPEHVEQLMADLVRFCETSPLSPLGVAAIAHAQLETVHPFADGNGRTGRALVHVVLRRRGLAPRIVPPISLVLATDKNRYIGNLAAFRTNRDDPASPSPVKAIDSWICYFAKATHVACARARMFEQRISEIESEWMEMVRPRKGSAAELLLKKLAGSPVVSVESAAELTGRSYEAARLAVARLQQAGVLRQNARNKKSNIYVAQAVVDAFTAYERSLAAPGGDTAAEKPVRAVPQRAKR